MIFSTLFVSAMVLLGCKFNNFVEKYLKKIIFFQLSKRLCIWESWWTREIIGPEILLHLRLQNVNIFFVLIFTINPILISILRRAGKFTSHPIQRVEKPDCAVWRTPLILPIGGEKLEKMMDFKKGMCISSSLLLFLN